MRPNNQNKRSRGRGGNNNRRHSNPLSRNYESNGPDVKIRGNAAHIAEKYGQLARDAQASGDSVMAENYLQHAEHYHRIILAAQAQMPQRNDDQPSFDNNDDNDDEAQSNTGKSEQSAAETDTPVEAKNADADSDDNDAPRRKPRERRPRRKPQSETANSEANGAGEDASAATKPNVNELPAFLTDGQASAAE